MRHNNKKEVVVTNACAWALVDDPSGKTLVMVYSDKENGKARVSCFSGAGMQRMSAEEYGFDRSLLSDIDRISDAKLIQRLGCSPISRDSQWHPGPWGAEVADEAGAKYKKDRR